MDTQTQEAPVNGHAFAGSPLARKLALIMGGLANLEKRGWNPHFKYNYVLSTDVYECARKLMAEHGVVLFQRMGARTRVGNLGDKNAVTYIDWEFEWVDGESGERQVVPWASEAQDGQDKGINKCATAARKYFLVTQLQIPVEQDDADAGPPPQQAHQRNGNGRQDPPPPPNGNGGNGSNPAQTYMILAQMAQRYHDEPAPLAHIIKTLAAEHVITEDLGEIKMLKDLPLDIVQKGIAVYQRLLEGARQ